MKNGNVRSCYINPKGEKIFNHKTGDNEIFDNMIAEQLMMRDEALEKTKSDITPLYVIEELKSLMFITVYTYGLRKTDISIKILGNLIEIAGESERNIQPCEIIYGQHPNKDFNLEIKLHEKYQGGDIHADYTDGVLTISINESKDYTKNIEIQ